MHSMSKYLVLAAGLVVLSGAEAAKGDLGCTIDDANLRFAVTANFSFRGDRPLFSVKANLDSTSGKMPPSIRHLEMSNENLIQQWFFDREIRLEFHAESDDHDPGSLSLAILTTQTSDEITYTGKYILTIDPEDAGHDPVELEGKATCRTG